MAEKQKATLKVIVARIVVGVLFSMLILSFAIWGIGPIFREGGKLRYVAEIGPVHITPQQFQEQYQREVRRLQTVLQTNIDAQRARDLHLPQRVVQDMIGRVLFDLAAQDAGIAIGDKVVRQSIFDNPAFHNAQGQFDRNAFQNILYNAGYSEDRFVQLTRQDLARSLVTNAITAGVTVPPELVDTLYRFRAQQRVAETLTIPAASIKDVPTPTEAELTAYHKDHADEFTAPEYRTITAVLIRPEDLVGEVTVPEDKVKNEYDARLADFRIPEQRELRQIRLPDEAKAKHAEELLAQGETFDKVAQEVTGKPPIDLGTVKQADIGNDALAAAAFEPKAGGVTPPVQSPLGWHIIQVVKVTPGSTQSFDQVKDKLRHELALRAAGDKVFDVGNKLQDALGGGASLEEAAQKLRLHLVKFASVDSKGDGPDGKPVKDLPKDPKFLSTAFSASMGRESDLMDDGQGGYFILRVDKADPSHLRPLAEVRAQVLAGWQAEARLKAAEKIAKELRDKAKGGTSLADLGKKDGYPVTTTKPFTRTGQGADAALPPDLVAALFAAKTGEVVTAAAPDGALVARLTEIKPVDAKANENTVGRLRDQLRGTIDGDLLNAFANALKEQYGVQVHEDVINGLIGS
jgi:peptidyl-prolyl cis-trans isomerase D